MQTIIQTSNFRTRTMYKEKKNAEVNGFWPIGLDVGYSSVKAISPNSMVCFPSFARRRTEKLENIGSPRFSDILYQDKAGGIWDVGEMANNSLAPNDVNDSPNTLYSRYRYDNPMFLVLARVGMALTMRGNSICNYCTKDSVVLQTGLPAAYEETDSTHLIEALQGIHEFSVKFGASPWRDYTFTLKPENIRVMSQPMGAYLGSCMGINGVLTDEGRKIFTATTAMLDGGFGTVDLCILSSSTHDILKRETFSNLGMMEIFRRTVKEITKTYGTEISVHAFQPSLARGTVEVVDRRAHSRSNVPFEEILLRHNEEVCNETLDKMEIALDGLAGIDCLLLAGGTCAGWIDIIKKRYELMDGLKIVGGKVQDDLPEIFNIVYGYFLTCALTCRIKQRENT